ncbi:hypothetical protein CN096_06745 [Sinorhizobium meliloti]|nr:hypothetical protein CN096_06745 [Sinorhizobium meliloti]
MWMRFLADYDWKPRPPVTIAFRAGDVKNVTRACAAAAMALGKAERTERQSNVRRTYARQTSFPAENRGR